MCLSCRYVTLLTYLVYVFMALSKSKDGSRGSWKSRRARVALVTTAWVSSSTAAPHLAEVKAAITVNMANEWIDQIHILLEGSTQEHDCSNFKSELEKSTLFKSSSVRERSKFRCRNWGLDQPTYYDMFDYASRNVSSKSLILLANADMVFDKSIRHLHELDERALLVVATSGLSIKSTPRRILEAYEQLTRFRVIDVANRCYNEFEFNRTSWDAYAFYSDNLRISSDSFVDNATGRFFPMNQNGAENAALEAVSRNSFFTQYSQICDHIKMWHFHTQPKMHHSSIGVKHDQLRPASCAQLSDCLTPSGLRSTFRSIYDLMR